jgi:hypothetical protein
VSGFAYIVIALILWLPFLKIVTWMIEKDAYRRTGPDYAAGVFLGSFATVCWPIALGMLGVWVAFYFVIIPVLFKEQRYENPLWVKIRGY